MKKFRHGLKAGNTCIGMNWKGFDYEYMESLEKGFHCSIDVGFREDRQVAQIETLGENIAVLRRIALISDRERKTFFKY